MDNKESITEKFESNKHRASEFFHKFIGKTQTKIPDYLLKSTYELNILYTLLESITLFIFSHEVAHYSCSHLVKENKSIEEKWYDEFEADLFATNRVVDLYRKNKSNLAFTLIAPIIFFKYLIILEQNNELLKKLILIHHQLKG